MDWRHLVLLTLSLITWHVSAQDCALGLGPGQYRKYEAICREVGRMPLEPTSEALLRLNKN
ncbi:MAG: hypothetical protein P8Z38_09800 [Robiginitalea sp.]